MRKLLIVLSTALGALALGKGPDVTAASAIVMDAESGKVLYQKNAEVPRYPASTTKVMTGLLLAENTMPDDMIVGPSDVGVITGSKMNLKPGEKVSSRDMLYALMLRSANDGCYAVALHLGGSVAGFSKMMNQRAQEIGCTRTHFNNPNGLNDPKHLTTARDLALMAREAMKNPDFAEVVKTTQYTLTSRTINQKDLLMVNKDKLLLWDSTAEGIKTGWTRPAGHCFVGSATRNGYRVITVVLKSEDWKVDTLTLWNWAFENHDRELVKAALDPIESVAVENGAMDQVQAAAPRDVYLTMPRGIQPSYMVSVKPLDRVEAPIALGQRVGTILITDDQGAKIYIPAVATEEVPKKSLAAAATSGWTPWVGLTLVGGTLYVRGKSRRRTKLYAARRLAQKRAYTKEKAY
jgi:serine-type D-Ala-D-Ala carboxypeptidase (penicillin-binding protein 5/6)